MMAMSETAHIDIEYVARLARIELSEDEKLRFSSQLDRVLGYCDKLGEVNLDGVEPMAHATPLYNVWDEDVAVEGFSPEQATANAPAKRENQIVVPKVVEDA
jgi:aspartyl-tRNA(Asn)/glutamyl-tRNA(Gln) amidotransferase subunit C